MEKRGTRRAGSAVLILASAAVLAGCGALPRGAPVQQEILAVDAAEHDFAIEPVTRERLAVLEHWPRAVQNPEGWLERRSGPMTSTIRPGDLVTLRVWDSSENSLLTGGSARNAVIEGVAVAPAGTLFVPYLGDVVIGGLTPDQARRLVPDQMGAILPAAQVQLTVEPGRASSADLIGGVARPGAFALPDRNYSVLNLISAGGGVQAGLQNPQVRLVRGGRSHAISVARLLSDPARYDVTLQGGDQVIVQADGRSFIALGATRRQEVIGFPSDRLSALEAVALIGGVDGTRADLQGVLVLREYPASALRAPGQPERAGPERAQVVFTLDLTTADGLFAARSFEIMPDDTVLVTESPVNSARTVLGIVGQTIGLIRGASSL